MTIARQSSLSASWRATNAPEMLERSSRARWCSHSIARTEMKTRRPEDERTRKREGEFRAGAGSCKFSAFSDAVERCGTTILLGVSATVQV